MLHKETVSKEMWELLQTLMKDEMLKDYVLVGGTALALRLGHRLSVDIDLFTVKDFDSNAMFSHLQNTYGAKEEESRIQNNTVFTYVNNVKVDIITHKYSLLNPMEENEGIRMISNEDIGAMKIHAIHQSGQRLKDFVDIYYLLEDKPLKFYLQAYERKYEGNAFWAGRALSFFGNVRKEYDVSMIEGKVKNWTKISERLQKAVDNPQQEFGLPKQTKINPPNKTGRGFRR